MRLMVKAKVRPIGHVTPGGYKKTSKGWVKVGKGIPKGYSSKRLNYKIQNVEDKRLFIDSFLKEDEKTWLDPKGDVKAATMTIDLISEDTAYFNRADALRSGKGYAREMLGAMIHLLGKRGISKIRGYIESSNIQSQNMLVKLGFYRVEEAREGAYWERRI